MTIQKLLQYTGDSTGESSVDTMPDTSELNQFLDEAGMQFEETAEVMEGWASGEDGSVVLIPRLHPLQTVQGRTKSVSIKCGRDRSLMKSERRQSRPEISLQHLVIWKQWAKRQLWNLSEGSGLTPWSYHGSLGHWREFLVILPVLWILLWIRCWLCQRLDCLTRWTQPELLWNLHQSLCLWRLSSLTSASQPARSWSRKTRWEPRLLIRFVLCFFWIWAAQAWVSRSVT